MGRERGARSDRLLTVKEEPKARMPATRGRFRGWRRDTPVLDGHRIREKVQTRVSRLKGPLRRGAVGDPTLLPPTDTHTAPLSVPGPEARRKVRSHLSWGGNWGRGPGAVPRHSEKKPGPGAPVRPTGGPTPTRGPRRRLAHASPRAGEGAPVARPGPPPPP